MSQYHYRHLDTPRQLAAQIIGLRSRVSLFAEIARMPTISAPNASRAREALRVMIAEMTSLEEQFEMIEEDLLMGEAA